jgi:ABC-type multidrug transport system ATPase subunit
VLCDQIIIISNGVVAAQGAPEELLLSTIAGERERQSLEPLLINPAPR